MDLTTSNLTLHPNSLVLQDGTEFALVRKEGRNHLAVLSEEALPGFEGERSELAGKRLILGGTTTRNLGELGKLLPWLRPSLLDLATSAGMGDRIGLATPGHVRAAKKMNGMIAPIFIQQSMREMARTNRTPRQVLEDATWGIFAEGWRGPHGADADHLKTTEDIDSCLECGYTFFTIDPGAHVDNRAETAGVGELRELAASLPAELGVEASELTGKTYEIEGLRITFDERTLLKAAVKYGKAVAHVAMMYRHLEEASGSRPFELEVSVDETEQPTTHAEHLYIACELKRLGVKWISLAPRYVGRFEKGVDYIGSVEAFEADFAGHATIARGFGPYKLSLHSGSDKFSIYAGARRLSEGLVHLKTAGTSYLEALRTLGEDAPGLFKEIYAFARERYEHDRASYHVSAELGRAPQLEEVRRWPDLLDQFEAREILHVTFGSVLTEKTPGGEWRFRDRLLDFLRANPEAYAANLEKHFIRHLEPFCPPRG